MVHVGSCELCPTLKPGLGGCRVGGRQLIQKKQELAHLTARDLRGARAGPACHELGSGPTHSAPCNCDLGQLFSSEPQFPLVQKGADTGTGLRGDYTHLAGTWETLSKWALGSRKLEDEAAFPGHRRAAPSQSLRTSPSVCPLPPGGTGGRPRGDSHRCGIG